MSIKRFRTAALALIAAGLVICLRTCLLSVETGSFHSSDSLVLVIDPGHGGIDGGAVSEGFHESVINLEIALKLDSIMGLFAMPVALTRESDEIIYPSDAKTVKDKKNADLHNRAQLVNSIPNAVLLSVHQNKFTTASPHGAQVFHSKTEGSEQFASNTQTILVSALDPDNHRKIKQIDSSIYLLKNVKCPAILVECGFMSNSGELNLLCDPNYQTKVAASLAASYISSYEMLEAIDGKG